jgi:choline dehydrogenase-like flavoprotein
MAKPRDFDVVIIGSGFGGSVAALRLTEKGYRVAVLEAGRRLIKIFQRLLGDYQNFYFYLGWGYVASKEFMRCLMF